MIHLLNVPHPFQRIAWASAVIAYTVTSANAQEVGDEVIVRYDAPPGMSGEETATFGFTAGFVAWGDSRDADLTGGDIYVQKVTSEGASAWTENGLLVCNAPEEQYEPAITPDGMGGAVVAWRDSRANATHIYAQRISADGNIQWTANGDLAGGTVWRRQESPNVHLASNVTFLLTYGGQRTSSNGFDTEYWLVAQKISSAGQRLWGDNGTDVIEGIRMMRSVPDGSDGLVVLGRLRGSEPTGFRIQRVLADQSIAWTNPVDIAATLSTSLTFDFGYAADGQGGVVLAYIENNAVRTVRVNAEGARPWGDAGVVIADTSVTTAAAPKVLPDGTGGAYISWLVSSPRDIHVQHLNADGSFLWPEAGAIVPYDAGGAETDVDMVSDDAGGLFFAWETTRGVHIHHMNSSGMIDWVNNGLLLTPGFDPRIGVGTLGPIIIYNSFDGISARIITLPAPLTLRLIAFDRLANHLTLTLDGGSPESDYDVLRKTDLGDPDWELIGTLKPGEPWTDPNPAQPGAFYLGRESATD